MAAILKHMIFIDGGYLRKGLEMIRGKEDFEIGVLSKWLWERHIQRVAKFDVIRIYYYDAICDVSADSVKYSEQKSRFDKIRSNPHVDVKLGQNIISKREPNRQKGVDVLIAVDMLTKAYEDHYDVATLFCGDQDFIPLIEAVKDYTGKRVFGSGFTHNYPDILRDTFDKFAGIQTSWGEKILLNIFG